jgi:hypothetical protein
VLGLGSHPIPSTTQARPQMLAQKSPTSTVWQQIGAQNPQAEAQQLMKQNDNFGY